ncbi:MAG: hypothetical protein NVSMB57_04210 [Actinomycetota bacterium]
MKTRVLLITATVALACLPLRAAIACTESWKQVGRDEFRAQGLQRSQGAASDGTGWIFSWQGGVSRTDDHYIEHAANTLPPEPFLEPQVQTDGTNHVGPTHIGDVDVSGGIIYASVEDGHEKAGPLTINKPEYQHPYVALYDATTLLYLRSYKLPLNLQEAGVPWVAVNGPSRELYSAEWEMPHDRINVYDLQAKFIRFINLHYPSSFAPNFHLDRIQGAKVLGNALYASVDDKGKSLYKIDLASGNVRKLFSINPGVPAELEGLAVRPTPDGALLHVLLVIHNNIDESGDFKDIAVQFLHYAPTCAQ